MAIGVLLAGGEGGRAGVDKRFLVLEGRTLLQRNLAFLHGLFPTVVLSLGQGQTLDLGDAAALGETAVVNDAWPGSSPLAGIATTLDRYRAPVFALAVDAAFPSRAASARVLAAFPGHDAAVPAIDHHHQPLFAVYGPGCLEPMKAMLEAGQQRIIDAYPEIDLAPVPFDSDELFHSVNTMDDYREARELARREAGAAGRDGGAAGRDDVSGATARADGAAKAALDSFGGSHPRRREAPRPTTARRWSRWSARAIPARPGSSRSSCPSSSARSQGGHRSSTTPTASRSTTPARTRGATASPARRPT